MLDESLQDVSPESNSKVKCTKNALDTVNHRLKEACLHRDILMQHVVEVYEHNYMIIATCRRGI